MQAATNAAHSPSDLSSSEVEQADAGAAGRASAAILPSTDQAQRLQGELKRVLDPTQAGWDTEAFNEAASSQLQRLALLLEKPDQLVADAVRSLIAEEFRCQPVRPHRTQDVFQDGAIVIRRRPLLTQGDMQTETTAEEFVVALHTLPLPRDADASYHVKFKIVHVAAASDAVDTRIFAEGGGHLSQWTATWKCEWTAGSDQGPPLLKSIAVEEYEEVLARHDKDAQSWLVDRTADVLGAAGGYQEQLAYGVDHWLERIEGRLGINRLGHNGLAVGDVNGDGREDLYVCQPGGLPNRLYVAQADGTALDVSHEAGVDFLDDTTCALFVDLDNDDDQDLVVITIAGGVVLSNEGAGRFVPRATLPDCRNAFSLTAADYDRDRRLDIYVGRYWPSDENRGEIPIPVPYYDAQNGGRNVLLRNVGHWEFVDVTADVGLDVDNTRYTMAAAWEDLDADGDVDLYVANDFGRNCLYRNDDGQFTNIAADAGVEDIASGMSVSFADYDHDGNTDIYVSNMFSSAGNRITYQRRYQDQFGKEDVSKIQRMARGNSLFRGQADGTFTDVSNPSGTSMGRWAWGSLFADLNNDAWDDLLVLNGFITTEDTGDL